MYTPFNSQHIQLTPYCHFLFSRVPKLLDFFPLLFWFKWASFMIWGQNMQNIIEICHLGKVTK